MCTRHGIQIIPTALLSRALVRLAYVILPVKNGLYSLHRQSMLSNYVTKVKGTTSVTLPEFCCAHTNASALKVLSKSNV